VNAWCEASQLLYLTRTKEKTNEDNKLSFSTSKAKDGEKNETKKSLSSLSKRKREFVVVLSLSAFFFSPVSLFF